MRPAPADGGAAARAACLFDGAVAGVVVVGIIGGGNLIESARVSSAQKTLNAAK